MEKEKAEIINRAKKYGRVQSLMQYVNLSTLKWVFQKWIKDKVRGVGAEYEKDLDENLNKLLARMKKFSYYPQSTHKNHELYGGNNVHKYEFRLLEDEIVKIVFKEILGAIYDSKILGLKISQTERDSRGAGKIRIYKAYVRINVKALLGYIDHELLISFLEQDIADKNFIRYIRRFLDSGVMNLGKKPELGILQKVSLSEMLGNVFFYYTLQAWAELINSKVKGKMCVVRNEEEFRFLFHNVGDAERVYLFLLRKLEKLGIRSAEDRECVLSVLWSDKVKYLQEYSQRYSTQSRKKIVF